MSLVWRLFLGNAAVVIVAAAVLAFSPATIHASITSSELLILAAGVAVMLIVDLLFVRSTLAPLRRLALLMGSVDLSQPGRGVGEIGSSGREVLVVAEAFDAMLARLEAERRGSARRALAAQESERVRVARELHDELGQALTAVALRAEDAAAGRRTDSQLAAFSEIADAVQRSLSEVRRIARELRPEALDDLGLVNALIALCARITGHSGLWIDRAFARDLPYLGAEIDLVIYRVAQEALTNALRHSRATQIGIGLTHEHDQVVLSVHDNGCGLPDPLGECNGLAGMKERALLVDARLELRSVRDQGVEVHLAVPVPVVES